MVPVDTVYQRVLALANKEQRGYITPLEFNLLANQAQMQIFEQYFYDLDRVKRTDSEETSFSDMEELIKNKLTPFASIQGIFGGVFPINYRIGKIFVGGLEAKKVNQIDYTNMISSPLHSDAMGLQNLAMYVDSPFAGQDIIAYGGGATCEVVVRPTKAEWGYDVIQEKALYHAGRSTNFELHDSEETELVYKILALAGIVINKVGLVSTASGLDQAQIVQEKQ
tara:strand:- start:466 stop:1137 length:672 start_codon:yes stop_codon:yes gene_type:complete